MLMRLGLLALPLRLEATHAPARGWKGLDSASLLQSHLEVQHWDDDSGSLLSEDFAEHLDGIRELTSSRGQVSRGEAVCLPDCEHAFAQCVRLSGGDSVHAYGLCRAVLDGQRDFQALPNQKRLLEHMVVAGCQPRCSSSVDMLKVGVRKKPLVEVARADPRQSLSYCSESCESEFTQKCLPFKSWFSGANGAEAYGLCRDELDEGSEAMATAGCVKHCAPTQKMLETSVSLLAADGTVPSTRTVAGVVAHAMQGSRSASTAGAATPMAVTNEVLDRRHGDFCSDACEAFFVYACLPMVNLIFATGHHQAWTLCRQQIDEAKGFLMSNNCSCTRSCISTPRMLQARKSTSSSTTTTSTSTSTSTTTKTMSRTTSGTGTTSTTLRLQVIKTTTTTRDPDLCSKACEEQLGEVCVPGVMMLANQSNYAGYQVCRGQIDKSFDYLGNSGKCRPGCTTPEKLVENLRTVPIASTIVDGALLGDVDAAPTNAACSDQCDYTLSYDCILFVQTLKKSSRSEAKKECKRAMDTGAGLLGSKEAGCKPGCTPKWRGDNFVENPDSEQHQEPPAVTPALPPDGSCSGMCELVFGFVCVPTYKKLYAAGALDAFVYCRAQMIKGTGLMSMFCNPTCSTTPGMWNTGSARTVKEDEPCPTSCEKAFEGCVSDYSALFNLSRHEAFAYCRAAIDNGQNNDPRAGCGRFCLTTDRMRAVTDQEVAQVVWGSPGGKTSTTSTTMPAPRTTALVPGAAMVTCSMACQDVFIKRCVNVILNLLHRSIETAYTTCRYQLDNQIGVVGASGLCYSGCLNTETMNELATSQAGKWEPNGTFDPGREGGRLEGVTSATALKLEILGLKNGYLLPLEHPVPWFYSSILDAPQGVASSRGFAAALHDNSFKRLIVERGIQDNLRGGFARWMPAWKGASWIVRGNCRDPMSPATWLKVYEYDGDTGVLILMTIHGRLLHMDRNGILTANRTTDELATLREAESKEPKKRSAEPNLSGAISFGFKLVDHPLSKPDSRFDCWIPARRNTTGSINLELATKTCIGIQDPQSGAMGLVHTEGRDSDKSKMNFRPRNWGLWQMQTRSGMLGIDMGGDQMVEWMDNMRMMFPYEIHRLEDDPTLFADRVLSFTPTPSASQTAINRDEQNNFGEDIEGPALPQLSMGFTAGFTFSIFLCLVLHNIWYAFKDTSPPNKLRMPEFDVARCVLEIMVVYEHQSFLGAISIKQHWMSAYRMPGFIFIAGIFGTSMEWRSVTSMWCYTLGTTMLLVFLRVIEMLVIRGRLGTPEAPFFGPDFDINEAAHTWFVVCLAFWRTIITPLAFCSRRYLAIKPAAFLCILWVVSWVLLHVTKDFQAWLYGNYNWVHSLVFAPIFAAGFLMKPAEWSALFSKRNVQAAALAYFVIWYVLTLSPEIVRFNRSYCLPLHDPANCYNHFYGSILVDPMNFGDFLYDVVMYVLRMGITLAFVALIYPFTELLGYVSPTLVDLFAGWGSRTLYTYVLHLHITNIISGEGGIGSYCIGLWPVPVRNIMPIFLSIALNATFASKGSERFFRWLLIPLWLKDVPKWFCFEATAIDRAAAWWEYIFPSEKQKEQPSERPADAHGGAAAAAEVQAQ